MKSPEGFEKDDLRTFFKKQYPDTWLFWPYMAGYGKSGVSDIIACVPRIITPQMVGQRLGLFSSCEVKREGKAPTPIQTRRMAEIEAAGGKTFWGTAAKVIPEFEEWIR